MPKPAAATDPPRHVLIARTDRLGDMMATLPAVHALKASFPRCRVTVLASSANAQAAKHHGEVDAVEVDQFSAAQTRIRGVWRLARRIRVLHCDAAVLMHSTPRLALAVWLARVPIRIGTAYRAYSILFNRRVRQHRRGSAIHEGQHNIRLLEPLGVPPTERPVARWDVTADERADIEAVLGRYGAINSPLAVLQPGSAGSALNWPPRLYGELGQRLAAHGLRIVVTGSPLEVELTRQVTGLAGGTAIDLGGISLLQLAALLERSAVYIGSGTGPTHLAAALGTRVVALYAPLRSCSPERWRPLGPHVTLVQPPLGIVCPTCLGTRCPHYHCMERHLSVDAAERAALDLLDRAAAEPGAPGERY